MADPLNRIISDIEGLIEKGGIFPPSLFGELLTELLVLRKVRDIAVAQPGGRAQYEAVHNDAEQEARYRKHEAGHGREWKDEYEQKPNASEPPHEYDPPHGYYDKLRDRYWNASKREWESGIDRERARRSDDDIAEKIRQARERMEREAFWANTASGPDPAGFDFKKFQEQMRAAWERTRGFSGFRDDDFRPRDPPPRRPGKGKRAWHEVLGVRDTATNPEIKKAYRRLAMKNHTDRGGTHDKMAEINVAWGEVKSLRGIT